VIDEINDSHPTALQAVRLLAVYLSREHEREQCVTTGGPPCTSRIQLTP
jgi:hypothetical protein